MEVCQNIASRRSEFHDCPECGVAVDLGCRGRIWPSSARSARDTWRPLLLVVGPLEWRRVVVALGGPCRTLVPGGAMAMGFESGPVARRVVETPCGPSTTRRQTKADCAFAVDIATLGSVGGTRQCRGISPTRGKSFRVASLRQASPCGIVRSGPRGLHDAVWHPCHGSQSCTRPLFL